MSNLAPWVQDPRPELTLKELFAEELLRNPNNAYAAAMKIFGMDAQRSMQVANEWVFDQHVIATQIALIKENGEDYYLPSKVQLARRIWDIGTLESSTIPEKLAAFRLYADLRNFIEKPTTNVGANITINQNKVMVMRDHGTDEEWEEKARAQQAKLVKDARD